MGAYCWDSRGACQFRPGGVASIGAIPMEDNAPEMIFYDGHCGLCHRFVKFVLKHDPDAHFHFAPLQSSRFESAVEPAQRGKLPDSVVVLTRKGKLLTRSAASLYVMNQLGGG